MTHTFEFVDSLTRLSKSARIGTIATTHPGYIDIAKQRVSVYCQNPAMPTQGYTECMEQAAKLALQEMANQNYELHRCELVLFPLEGMLSQINLIAKKYPKKWNPLVEDFLVTAYGDFSDFLLGYKQIGRPARWKELSPPSREQATYVAQGLSEILGTLFDPPYAERLDPLNECFVNEIQRHLSLHFPAPERKKTPPVSQPLLPKPQS